MVRKPTLQDYVYWAVNYRAPQPKQPGDYVYYFPYPHDPLLPQGFQYASSPISPKDLFASRLVPATMRARVQLVLDYHQAAEEGTAIIWSKDGGNGELIAYYESLQLWGSTAFAKKEGKQETVFAKSRERLLERAFRHKGRPLPNALKQVRQLPGMGEIVPMLLLPAQEHLLQQEKATLSFIEHYDVQIASDREPLWRYACLPPEWLVTILVEERHMILRHCSLNVPTSVEVLRTLCSRMLSFEGCTPGEWEETKEAEEWPFIVCEQEMCDLKALLGTAYLDFLCVFDETPENGEGYHLSSGVLS